MMPSGMLIKKTERQLKLSMSGPPIKGPNTDVYFIYPLELRNSKRINVFKDFIMRKIAEDGLVRVVLRDLPAAFSRPG